MPYYIEASQDFPYTEGEAFVLLPVRRGGWRAIDSAYRMVPTTTGARMMFLETLRRR